jgi:hypothetical protein
LAQLCLLQLSHIPGQLVTHLSGEFAECFNHGRFRSIASKSSCKGVIRLLLQGAKSRSKKNVVFPAGMKIGNKSVRRKSVFLDERDGVLKPPPGIKPSSAAETTKVLLAI